MTDSRKPVFLVIGAGAGIGGNAAMRFAAGGYHAVLARRSDEEGLARMVAQIEAAGGSASGTLLNAGPDPAPDLRTGLAAGHLRRLPPCPCAIPGDG